MNTQQQEQAIISIPLEILLQLLELADRLVKLGYSSRTESKFLDAFSKDLLASIQKPPQLDGEVIIPESEQNNKVDENSQPVIPLE